MILQALVDCYEALSASGKIARPGWGPVKTSIALELTETGEISQAIFLKEEVEKGKKKALVPKIFDLPAPVKRTVGVAANFLCDNPSSVSYTHLKNGKQDGFIVQYYLHRSIFSISQIIKSTCI